jgi:hypothetical protein
MSQEGKWIPLSRRARPRNSRSTTTLTAFIPFHIHVNSFEVMGLPSDPNYRRLHDTVWLPPFSKLTMRTRFKTWGARLSIIATYRCTKIPR